MTKETRINLLSGGIEERGWLSEIDPSALDMPSKYTEWRDAQARAIEDVVEELHGDKWCVVVNAPVGLGKSGIGVGVANVQNQLIGGQRGYGYRAAYLTATKALMDQMIRDRVPGMVEIKGRGNYQCQELPNSGYTCEEYHTWCRKQFCHKHGRGHSRCQPGRYAQDVQTHTNPETGEAVVLKASAYCETWSGECGYRQARQDAINARLPITNYAYWCQTTKLGGALGEIDLLICDEAHDAPDQVCKSLEFTLTPGDLTLCGESAPTDPTKIENWKPWAEKALAWCVKNPAVRGKDAKQAVRWNRRRARLAEKASELVDLNGDWVIEGSREGWQVSPVWPYQHAHRVLFSGAKKVLLMSATITKKTMSLLGVGRDEYTMLSYPYVFPKKNAKTYHLVVGRDGVSGAVNYKAKPETIRLWLQAIRAVIAKRPDRKGIVHSVSYQRAEEIYEYLRREDPDSFRRCVLHGRGDNAQKVIAQFKASRQPLVLLSPSVTTGHDFAYQDCEFQVLTKLPFPSSQSGVMKERSRLDKLYTGHVMVQELVQSAGRGMRAPDDRCETFLVDDSWFWAGKRYSGFLPPWFKIETVDYIPKSPKSIQQVRIETTEREKDDVPF